MVYLDKIVKQERTGSSITGINVDTSISNMINPVNVTGNPIKATGTIPTYRLEILDTIEKYAQEADKAKIANAKIKLNLDLEQARLDLEEKWSTVNDKFSNEERYNEYLKAKKDLLSEQEKIINTFKYMNKEEKALTLAQNNVNYREDYIKTQGTRNAVYTQQQIDNADANIKQAISLASNLGIHDDKKAKEYHKMIADLVETKKNLAGLTDEQAIVMIANYSKTAEMGRFQNHLEEIKMSDMTYQQKEKKLKQIKQAIENKELMKENIKEIVEMFPVDNKKQAEEYLLTEMTDLTSKMVNGYHSQIKEVNRQRKEQEKAEARAVEKNRKFLEDMDKLINPEQYTDKAKAFKKIHGRAYNIDDIKENRIVFDWESLGDFNNTDEIKIFPDQVMKNLKNAIDFNIINNDYSEADALNLVKAKAVEMLGNDQGKIKAFIRQYSQANNVNPIALYYGDKNPHLYLASQALENGKAIKDSKKIIVNDLDNSNWVFWSGGKKIYNEAKKSLSDDPNRANEIMNRFIAGRLIQKGKTVTTTTANTYLEEEFNTTTEQKIFKSIPMLKRGGYPKANKAINKSEANNSNISDIIGME